MIRSLFKDEPTDLDRAIAEIHAHMNMAGPDSEEYAKLIGYLDRLMTMKSQIGLSRPSADTILAVAGNLLGILFIIAYEREHVLVSKALGFIMKTKV